MGLMDKIAEVVSGTQAPVEAEPEQAVAAPEPTINLGSLTMGQITELLMTVVREAKRPDPYEEAKILAERQRQENVKQERIKQIQLERQVQLCTWGDCDHADKRPREMGGECFAFQCSHRKQNGQPYVQTGQWGQVMSDGFVHQFCGACQKEFVSRPVGDMVATGFGIPA